MATIDNTTLSIIDPSKHNDGEVLKAAGTKTFIITPTIVPKEDAAAFYDDTTATDARQQDPQPPPQQLQLQPYGRRDNAATTNTGKPSSKSSDNEGEEKETVEEAAKTKTPAKPRKRWKKPPGKPCRPLSAYNLFFKKERASMIGQEAVALYADPLIKRMHRKTHGVVGFAEMAKMIGSKWKSLTEDDKKEFTVAAAVEKERYRKELDNWREEEKIKSMPLKKQKRLLIDDDDNLEEVIMVEREKLIQQDRVFRMQMLREINMLREMNAMQAARLLPVTGVSGMMGMGGGGFGAAIGVAATGGGFDPGTCGGALFPPPVGNFNPPAATAAGTYGVGGTSGAYDVGGGMMNHHPAGGVGGAGGVFEEQSLQRASVLRAEAMMQQNQTTNAYLQHYHPSYYPQLNFSPPNLVGTSPPVRKFSSVGQLAHIDDEKDSEQN